jgi:hypothetical protein
MDRDSMSSWLATVTAAKAAQSQFRKTLPRIDTFLRLWLPAS